MRGEIDSPLSGQTLGSRAAKSSGSHSEPMERFAAKNTGAHVTYSGPASVGQPLDQYQRLIESLTNHAIFSLSADGRIATWNSGAKLTFGYDEHEVVGKNYSLIFTAGAMASGRPGNELRAALEHGKESVDGWHVRKDG